MKVEGKPELVGNQTVLKSEFFGNQRLVETIVQQKPTVGWMTTRDGH